jgi:hypothetical protein
MGLEYASLCGKATGWHPAGMTLSESGAVKFGIDIIDKGHETREKLLVSLLDSPLTGTYTIVLDRGPSDT